MSEKKNIIIIILLFIFFFLLFPLKVDPNLKYLSSEAKELDTVSTGFHGEKIPFIYKQRAGYFSQDLQSSWSTEVRDGVALLNDRYINFSRAEGLFNIQKLSGEIEYSISDKGYPFSIDNRLFVIGRDRKSLAEIEKGKVLWSHKFNYIITSIDANKSSVAAGFIKGNYIVINNDGNIFFDYEPGGSRISIVYSVVISDDSKYLGVVSGLEPQRFILYQKKEHEYKPVHVLNIKDDFRRSLKIFITRENKKVFIEGKKGFHIVDIDLKESSYIEDDHSLKNAEYISDLNIYMVHTGASNFNSIKLLTSDNRVLMDKNFISEHVSMLSRDNSIYVVLDNTAIKLKIEEER